MFIPYNSELMPTEEGIASLVSAGLCSAESADAMRACMAVQEKLPSGYRVVGVADGPWVTVMAPWDGEPVPDDLSSALGDALKPLTMRGVSFSDGAFYWSVAMPELGVPAAADSPAEPSEEGDTDARGI